MQENFDILVIGDTMEHPEAVQLQTPLQQAVLRRWEEGASMWQTMGSPLATHAWQASSPVPSS